MNMPNGWKKGRLGEVCSIEIGGTPSRNIAEYWDAERETGNSWVSIKDMRQRIITETAEHISDAGVKCSNVKLQAPGTVLLSFKLTIGRVAVAGVPLYTNEAIASLKPKGLSPEYLYHGLQHWDLLGGVDQAIKGATLNKKKLKRIKFKYPMFESEQVKIAEILSTVDRAIEQTEALIAKQQRIKTGLMQDLLTRGIDKHGNLRSEETHEFKDSPLGRIPVEWKVCSCEQLCSEIVVGIVIRPAQYYCPDGVPVLRSANVRPGWISTDDLVFMSTHDNEALRKSQLRTGDLVTVRTGYPGTTAVVSPELDGCNCVDIVISRPKKETIRSDYLSLWVNSDSGKRQVLEGQGGLAQQHFNVGEMRCVLVKAPKLKEQEHIEHMMRLHEHAFQTVQRHLANLHSLKTALMQDLLTGKVRIAPLLTEQEEASA